MNLCKRRFGGFHVKTLVIHWRWWLVAVPGCVASLFCFRVVLVSIVSGLREIYSFFNSSVVEDCSVFCCFFLHGCHLISTMSAGIRPMMATSKGQSLERLMERPIVQKLNAHRIPSIASNVISRDNLSLLVLDMAFNSLSPVCQCNAKSVALILA